MGAVVSQDFLFKERIGAPVTKPVHHLLDGVTTRLRILWHISKESRGEFFLAADRLPGGVLQADGHENDIGVLERGVSL